MMSFTCAGEPKQATLTTPRNQCCSTMLQHSLQMDASPCLAGPCRHGMGAASSVS